MEPISITRKTAKALYAFLGKQRPETFANVCYRDTDNEFLWIVFNDGRIEYPAYQLHDLLSEPFCKAMCDKLDKEHWPNASPCNEAAARVLSRHLFERYYQEGLLEVEAALMLMMEGEK